MPRKPEQKKAETVSDEMAKDRDFTIITLPRPLHEVTFHLAFSPAIPADRMGKLLAAQRNFYSVAYVRGAGATVQHLSNLEGYNHTSLIMLSPYIFVLVHYDRAKFNGFRYIAQAITGIDNAAFYAPGYNSKGEVDRVTRQPVGGVKQEIEEVKEAIKAQAK